MSRKGVIKRREPPTQYLNFYLKDHELAPIKETRYRVCSRFCVVNTRAVDGVDRAKFIELDHDSTRLGFRQ